jgi:hypothetical protein
MEILKKIQTVIIMILEIPFFWTSRISLPSFMMILTLFSIIILILIDPISSTYVYFNLNKKEGSAFNQVKFVSTDSYKAAIDIFLIVTFSYLVKTDAGFIDKFIKFLEVFKNAKNSIVGSISKKISRKEK